MEDKILRMIRNETVYNWRNLWYNRFTTNEPTV